MSDKEMHVSTPQLVHNVNSSTTAKYLKFTFSYSMFSATVPCTTKEMLKVVICNHQKIDQSETFSGKKIMHPVIHLRLEQKKKVD